MASWDTPAVAAPTTASYAAPQVDFSKVGNLLQDFVKGRQMGREEDKAQLFRNGIPKDAGGNIDVGAVTEKLAAINPDYAMPLINMQLQSQMGAQAAGAITGAGGAPGAPAQPGPQASAPQRPAAPQGAPPQQATATQPQGATVLSILAAQGVPNDQLGAASDSVSRQLGVGPNDPIDTKDPQVANVLRPAIAQLKRSGIGQVVQEPSATPQAAPQAGQHEPQPSANPVVSQPSDAQRLDAEATFIRARAAAMASVNPKAAEVLNKEADARADKAKQLRDQSADAPAIKEWRQSGSKLPYGEWLASLEGEKERARQSSQVAPSVREWQQSGSKLPYDDWVAATEGAKEKARQDSQTSPAIREWRQSGSSLPYSEWIAQTEGDKETAKEDAKAYAAKYTSLVDNGTKAQSEIPQLDLLQEQMKDPNFFSGAGEKYNLLYKRLKSAVGIDPEAAVPQEYLRKATAANVLSSLGALKGLGQIRVAEINMAREAAASPENSVPANQLLVEISKRTHQRNAEIADLAQSYKLDNGQLDAGFDKKVTAYYKAHPLFSDAEIKDWHKIIGQAPAPSPAVSTGGPQPASVIPKFSTAEDAMKSGLAKGQTFYVGDKQYRVK